MVVHLLAWVVLVNVGPVSLDLVDAILDAEDAAGDGVLRDAHAVAEAPAQTRALRGVVERTATGQVANIKGPDLRVPGTELLGHRVHVVGAAPRHHQGVAGLARQQKGP